MKPEIEIQVMADRETSLPATTLLLSLAQAGSLLRAPNVAR